MTTPPPEAQLLPQLERLRADSALGAPLCPQQGGTTNKLPLPRGLRAAWGSILSSSRSQLPLQQERLGADSRHKHPTSQPCSAAGTGGHSRPTSQHGKQRQSSAKTPLPENTARHLRAWRGVRAPCACALDHPAPSVLAEGLGVPTPRPRPRPQPG